MDICSFCYPILPNMLFKASSNDAPFSTSGITSGGVTLSIPGSFVLVEIRALILFLDVFSLSTSGSADALPSLCFYSPQFASPNLSYSQSLLTGLMCLCLCLSFSPPQICPWFQSLCRCMSHSPGRTIEADSRSKVNLLIIVLFFLLRFTFISSTHPHGEWKDVSKSVLHSF